MLFTERLHHSAQGSEVGRVFPQPFQLEEIDSPIIKQVAQHLREYGAPIFTIRDDEIHVIAEMPSHQRRLAKTFVMEHDGVSFVEALRSLAEKAGIAAGMSGVDLCCCNGAGMRFLVRFRNVARMHGVDATDAVRLPRGARCHASFVPSPAADPSPRRGRRPGPGRLAVPGRLNRALRRRDQVLS